MSTTGIAVLVVVVLLAAAAVPLLGYLGSRQRKALIGYAETQGWTYRDEDPALAGRYRGAPFVGVAAPDARSDADPRAEAVITGRFGDVDFAAYAYTFKPIARGSNRPAEATPTVPVVALLVGSGLPDIDVLPRAATGGWGPSARRRVSTPEEFAAVFEVYSDDERFAKQMLGPTLVHALLAHPERAWAFRGGDLLSIGSWNGKPERLPAYLDHLTMILHAVPGVEWEAHGGRPPALGTDRSRPDQPNSSST